MKICIIGGGTYGAYCAHSVLEQFPEASITIFDVGNKKLRSEFEIGFLSNNKLADYQGLTSGRWFGLGGTSGKWGGQILTFDINDFDKADSFTKDIVSTNIKYKKQVLQKLGLKNETSDKPLGSGIFIKTGVWLSLLHRNLFNYLKIGGKKQITIKSDCRISNLDFDQSNKISGVTYIQNDLECKESFDFYFLTTGAFEIARLLMSSQLVVNPRVYFSDHLSKRIFKIKGGTKIGADDFVFRINGMSLTTKRIIGEIDGISFYAHPVFNLNFPFFQSLKEILIKRKISINLAKSLFKDIPQVGQFIFSVLVKRKMFVMNDEWHFYIDIENLPKEGYIELSDQLDKYEQRGLNVYHQIGTSVASVYMEATTLVENYLKKNHVDYERVDADNGFETYEDIYHPFGMFSDFNTVGEYYNWFENMLVVSTGVLPRSGPINPTAALFPLVDDFVINELQKRIVST